MKWSGLNADDLGRWLALVPFRNYAVVYQIAAEHRKRMVSAVLWRGARGPFEISGDQVERVNEYYFYWLSSVITPLENLFAGMGNVDAFNILYPALKAIETVLKQDELPLPMCGNAAEDLRRSVDEPIDYIVKPDAPDNLLNITQIGNIDRDRRKFETVLSIQMDQLDTYRVTAKGTHDTRKLVATPEVSFSAKHWALLSDIAKKDWVAAAKCLSFDVPTACGFHAIRALEAIAIDYLKKLNVVPQKRDLGHYLDLLKNNGADPKAIEAADQLRGLHRNPLMHPEDFLETDDALDVFDLCKSGIKALLRDREKRGLV